MAPAYYKSNWQKGLKSLLKTVKKKKDLRICSKVRFPITDLFRALTHDDTAPLVILQGAVGMAHHLKHIIDGVVHIAGDRREK